MQELASEQKAPSVDPLDLTWLPPLPSTCACALRKSSGNICNSLFSIAQCVQYSVSSSVLKNDLYHIQSDRLSLSIVYRAIHFNQ